MLAKKKSKKKKSKKSKGFKKKLSKEYKKYLLWLLLLLALVAVIYYFGFYQTPGTADGNGTNFSESAGGDAASDAVSKPAGDTDASEPDGSGGADGSSGGASGVPSDAPETFDPASEDAEGCTFDDSDGGFVITEKGYCDDGKATKPEGDYCTEGGTLVEYYLGSGEACLDGCQSKTWSCGEGFVCEDGACVEKCSGSDSDGGYTKYEKGTCDDMGAAGPKTDYCDGEALVEYWMTEDCFCEGSTTQFYCPSLGDGWTCSDGVCIEQDVSDDDEDDSTECTDSDSSKKSPYLEKGTCSDGKSKSLMADECRAEGEAILYEYYVDEDHECSCEIEEKDCTEIDGNMVCSDGACTCECSESDYSSDNSQYKEKGTYSCQGSRTMREDYCEDGYLHEYKSKSGSNCYPPYPASGTEVVIDCESEFGENWVCNDGACTEVDANMDCSNYCAGLSRSSYTGGFCAFYGNNAASKDAFCVQKAGTHIGTTGDDKCNDAYRGDEYICCCR